MFKVKSLAIMARSHCGPRLTACAVHPLRPRDLQAPQLWASQQTRHRLAADWPRSGPAPALLRSAPLRWCCAGAGPWSVPSALQWS